MKKIIYIALCFCAIASTSCRKTIGEGPVRTESRPVGNFASIDAGIPGEILFTQGPNLRLELEAQQNILDVLETYVSAGRLVIKVRSNRNIKTSERIVVRVEGPMLEAFHLSGSGNARVAGAFVVPDLFTASVSGSGNLQLDSLRAARMSASVSGSGYLSVGGGAIANATYRVSGSGHLEASNLESARVDAATSGSGGIRLFATQWLTASVSGSGGIAYRGNPQVEVHVSGSGRVTRL